MSAQIDPRGEWIEVSNSTRRTLIILGYAREPYLRVTPTGVDANVNAPSWALNHSLFGDLSQLGDTSLKPEWQHIQNDSTASWHDHRIHWMGVQRPPAVAADPAVGHLLGRWTVHMTLGGTPVDLHGTLSWIALPPAAHHGDSTVVGYGIGGAVAVTAISGVLVWRRRRGRRAIVEDAAAADASAVPDLVGS